MQNTTLLVDGAAAFNEILACVDAAERSILINMFIWRNDAIGNNLAHAVLRAAERGVRVTISVDRVGMILECCEESEQSFFHKRPRAFELLKIWILRWSYPANRSGKKTAWDNTDVLGKLLSHPNVALDRCRQKNDHSKYYIFDDRILIFGGINVEDKEIDRDCAGRIYQDYMLKMEGEVYIRAFLDKLERNLDTAEGYRFRMNNKTVHPASFEMYERFLSIINSAQKELVIVMAYFAPIPSVLQAIVSAWKRGVAIRILIPECANFQNNSNRKTVRLLMKRCCDGIQVRLSPKMVHTKLIYNENTVMFGSCNITNRAFSQLGELDIEMNHEDSRLIRHIKESVNENFSLSQSVEGHRRIRYVPILAWVESRFN